MDTGVCRFLQVLVCLGLSTMDSFVIRTYGRTELAQIYCPNLCPEAAFRKLKHWIDLCPDLRDGLSALGGSSRSRSYTPAQVRLIVAALGEP